MEENSYIIVFKDGTIMIFGRDPGKDCFQKDTKCFKVPESFTVENVRTFVYTHNCETEFYSKVTKVW